MTPVVADTRRPGLRQPRRGGSAVNFNSYSPDLLFNQAALDAMTLTAGIASWGNTGSQGAATQATGSAQPTVQSITNNGKTFRAARFVPASSQVLSIASFVQPAQWTAFIVAQLVNPATFGGVADPTLAAIYGLLSTDTVAGVARHAQIRTNATAQSIAFSDSANATDTQAATLTSWNVYEVVRAAATVEVFVNGVSGGSTAIAGVPRVPNVPVAIGSATTGGSSFFSGYQAFLMRVPAAQGSSDRSAIRTQLGSTFGITVA